MTLPQKLKRLAAFDGRNAREASDDYWDGCEDSAIQMEKSHERGAESENSRLQPLIEALIDCVEAAKLFASFAPKGPVPEGLCPSFYHTLNYADEVKLQERIDAGREALTALEKLSGDV